MGASSYYRAPGQSDLDHFRAENPNLNIVDGATKRGAFYAAIEYVEGGRAYISCTVFKVTRIRTPKFDEHSHNFCVKAADETSGPVHHDCPARILDMLSPLEEVASPGSSSHEWAGQWRESCRAAIDRETQRPKITKGDTIRFAQPYTLADEHSTVEDVFELTDARRNYFRTPLGSPIHLPSTWRERPYTVLTDGESTAVRVLRRQAYWAELEA